MAIITLADLAGFPIAQAISEPDVEAILRRHVADFIVGWDLMRAERPDLNLPPFNTENLESSETRILFRPGAFREMLLRGRINDAVRANLLAYSTGSDIDHLAAWHGVVRMPGEGDHRLKIRTILASQGKAGGSAPYYRGVALAADVRVADARAYRMGRSPQIHVAILSEDNGGLADGPLVAAVHAAINDPAVRMINDTISAEAAVKRVVNVNARAWLLPNAADIVYDEMAASLRKAWEAEGGIGFDFVPEWASSRLMIGGVQRAQVLNGYDTAGENEAIALGTISIDRAGRAY